MTVYLVRHARAGRRSTWKGDDSRRPLSKVGRRQAQGLLDVLADAGVTRILSSPALRCRQSVEPLADRLQLPVEVCDALAEHAPPDESLRLLDKVVHETPVLCTHGDVVRTLLEHLGCLGVDLGLDAGSAPMAKGSIWALETDDDGAVTTARYLPPPG